MGKKRKLGQLDEAPPQPAEAEKQKPEQVVVSVDDAGKPLEPGKQIGLIQAEVLPNPNEVAVQAFTNPVPEIEAGPEEPPAKKRKERKKKQKQVDDCVDVAGKASEPSKEVELIQAKPAEVPPPNPTVGVESGAGPSSNPVAEIGARAAALLLPNPVAKGEEKSEEARMIPEAKTEEATVKKKKKKLRVQMEMEKMQSTVTTQCGDDVENNGEAKSIEEDGLPKKRKKNKKQKLGEVMEMQGGTVTACVDDVEKNGEAKINEMVQKPVQVVAEMEGSKDTVTVCVGVENNGKINEGGEVAKLLAMHGLTMTAAEVENNGEAKSIKEDGLPKKRKKNKKQKLGEVMEMQGTVTTCVDDVEKNGELKINEMVQKPVQVVAEMEGSKDTMTVCIGVENSGKIDEGGEVAKLLAMHGLTMTAAEVENNGRAKSIKEDGPPKMRKKNKKQKLGEVMEMQGTVTTCVDDVEKNGEAKINEMVQRPVQVVAEMEGSKDTVTVCVGVEDNGKIDEGGEVAKLLAMHGLTMTAREVENMKRKRKEDKEMGRINLNCVDARLIVKLLPLLRPNVERKPEVLTESEELKILRKKRKQFKEREHERRPGERKRMKSSTFSVDDAGKIVEAKTSEEHKEENTSITCVDAGKNVELLPSLVPNVERKPEVLTESEELEIWLKRCKQAAKREKEMRQREKEKSRIAFSGDDAGDIVEAKTSEELEIQLKKPKQFKKREEERRQREKKTRRGSRGGKGRRRGGKGRRTFSVDDAGKIVEAKTSQEHKEDNTVRNAMLTYRHRLVLTSTEWKKKQLILSLRRKAVAEKQKEKKSTEEKVEKKKKASTNEKAEEQTVKVLQVCVICRGKGHFISTCPLLNQAQTNNNKSGKKLPQCSQPFHHVELKNGEAEPENTLVKD